MPSTIKPEDKPVFITIDQSTPQTSYVVHDVHGTERARFYDQEDANDYIDGVNNPAPEPTPETAAVLMQSNMGDSGVERAIAKKREKPKGRKMPRGIPKKKSKKVKKAAVVKKTAKKTMKRRKRRV